jgi:lipopolysaccharide transport protein LptA|tara:strand:- start:1637 stop:2044 length:408 start_codon:yes stop_codon:yes gene_type:complete
VIKLFFVFLIFFSFSIFSKDLNEHVKIKSDSIEFYKEYNQINFKHNVEIKSDFISIEASSAIYDNSENSISLTGTPTTITSNKDNNDFSGTANKIIFYTNEKVHLIGNAKMIYENLTISSDLIIFNPMTGKFSSE